MWTVHTMLPLSTDLPRKEPGAHLETGNSLLRGAPLAGDREGVAGPRAGGTCRIHRPGRAGPAGSFAGRAVCGSPWGGRAEQQNELGVRFPRSTGAQHLASHSCPRPGAQGGRSQFSQHLSHVLRQREPGLRIPALPLPALRPFLGLGALPWTVGIWSHRSPGLPGVPPAAAPVALNAGERTECGREHQRRAWGKHAVGGPWGARGAGATCTGSQGSPGPASEAGGSSTGKRGQGDGGAQRVAKGRIGTRGPPAPRVSFLGDSEVSFTRLHFANRLCSHPP